MRIYVASSWRNIAQPAMVERLRAEGHEVYDFRNPAPGTMGFRWSELDVNWEHWAPRHFRDALNHPYAHEGYRLDKQGLDWADACVLLLPCGRSAHLEAGYMIGQGKPTFVLLSEELEPELMYKLAEELAPAPICLSLDEVCRGLGAL